MNFALGPMPWHRLPSGPASRRQTAVSPDCKARLAIHRAPYEVNGQVVGMLGVIGPTRTAYDRMIQIVDITSRLVSNALSQK